MTNYKRKYTFSLSGLTLWSFPRNTVHRKEWCLMVDTSPTSADNQQQTEDTCKGKKNVPQTSFLPLFSKQHNVTISDSICIILVSYIFYRWFKVCRKKCIGNWEVLCHFICGTSQISGPSGVLEPLEHWGTLTVLTRKWK